MTRGRPPADSVKWHISLPVDLAAAIEALLFDPLSMSAPYGARSKLVNELLEKWLSEQTTSPETSHESTKDA